MARDGRLFYRACKRTFDITFSALVLVFAALPMGLACALIRLESPGAAICSQGRVGKDGKAIRVHKLRSMVADAENVEKYLSPDQLAQWGVERKVDDDPRITGIGCFIRKTSLDELPQFWDVLRGDMSVVGPRPITKDELDAHFTDGEKASLLSVRPGITGPWQTGRRNDATFETGERQRIELSYVRDCGFYMDARCILGTLGAMFGKGATGR